MAVCDTRADIDECEISTADCAPSDDCVNTEGSFECLPRCADGFRRSQDSSMHCLGILAVTELCVGIHQVIHRYFIYFYLFIFFLKL